MITSREEGFRRKDDTPRKVRNGIRLRTKDEEVSFNWPAGAWLDRLLAPYADETRSEGLDFARRGQTVLLNKVPGAREALGIARGCVVAKVGSRRRGVDSP